MTVERLGPLDPVSKFNKTEKSAKPAAKEKSDSISFSEEAKTMGELYKVAESVKTSPEIRQDRVNEVKEKLKNPAYISEKVIESVADSVLELFGL
ncbi:MAG: flagellar biosynthesis anti-sigma factor FlgM [Spirochaetota bacterium]